MGDEWSDPELMEFLGAKLTHEFGNNLYVNCKAVVLATNFI